MRDDEYEAIKNQGDLVDCLLSIDGEVRPVSLRDDMTLEKFKSFLLRETKNKKFFLEHLLGNDQTLGELKAKCTDQQINVTIDKKDFDLSMTSSDGIKLDKTLKWMKDKNNKVSESTKLKYLMEQLQKDNHIDTKVYRYKITF